MNQNFELSHFCHFWNIIARAMWDLLHHLNQLRECLVQMYGCTKFGVTDSKSPRSGGSHQKNCRPLAHASCTSQHRSQWYVPTNGGQQRTKFEPCVLHGLAVTSPLPLMPGSESWGYKSRGEWEPTAAANSIGVWITYGHMASPGSYVPVTRGDATVKEGNAPMMGTMIEYLE